MKQHIWLKSGFQEPLYCQTLIKVTLFLYQTKEENNLFVYFSYLVQN